jgi:hypothetical protein
VQTYTRASAMGGGRGARKFSKIQLEQYSSVMTLPERRQSLKLRDRRHVPIRGTCCVHEAIRLALFGLITPLFKSDFAGDLPQAAKMAAMEEDARRREAVEQQQEARRRAAEKEEEARSRAEAEELVEARRRAAEQLEAARRRAAEQQEASRRAEAEEAAMRRMILEEGRNQEREDSRLRSDSLTGAHENSSAEALVRRVGAGEAGALLVSDWGDTVLKVSSAWTAWSAPSLATQALCPIVWVCYCTLNCEC